MGHYTEIPNSIPCAIPFFPSWGQKQKAFLKTDFMILFLIYSFFFSYQAGKWLRIGLGIVGHYTEKLIWIHNVSYTLPKLFHNLSLTGSLYWILYYGFTGNGRGIGLYSMSCSQFGSLYRRFYSVSVTILTHSFTIPTHSGHYIGKF